MNPETAFAYGLRNGRRAQLDGYRLIASTVAFATPDEDSLMHGIVWDVHGDFASLDHLEAGYDRVLVPVTNDDGAMLLAWVYVTPYDWGEIGFSEPYGSFVLAAARDWQLPDQWRRRLEGALAIR